MIQYVAIFSLFLFSLGFSPAFAVVDEITTDKSSYYDGETMYVSGTVSTDLPVTSVSVVVFDPARLTFVALAPAISNSDGSFSVAIHVGGPLWTSYGSYPVQATSENTNKETIIEYLESPISSTPEPESQSTPEPESQSTPEPESQSTPEPTLKIPASFVDTTKNPQYYVDRYDNEPIYKEWFDANYSQYSSIYEAVGLDDPAFIPEWIHNNAELWYTGTITDSAFVSGIEYMLENNIIVISNIPSSGTVSVSDDAIPEWVRDSAYWWSQDLISEDEFVNSLRFLIQEGIIIIN